MSVASEAAAGVPEASGAPSGARKGRSAPTLAERAIVLLLGGLLAVSLFFRGFYDESVWQPIALALLVLALGLFVARRRPHPRLVAMCALGGLVLLWVSSLLSISWAESADRALIEVNRWALYAALFAVVLMVMRRDRSAQLLIGATTAGVLVLALYLVGRMLLGDGPGLFAGSRLNEPIGYVNGLAGYLLLGIWPLVALAERAWRPLVAGAALAGATLIAAVVVLTQTRAIVPAIVASTLIVVAAVPGRRTRLWALITIGVALALALDPLLDVYRDAAGARPSAAGLERAARSSLLASLLGGAVWALAARLRKPVEQRAGSGRAAVASSAALAALLGAGLAAVVVAVGNPVERVRDQYSAFVNLRLDSAGASRFTSGGGYRYDYWRVAASQFSANRLKGAGAGNYYRAYFRERRTSEDIRQPHSIELQTLAELGIVGGAALLLFLAGVIGGFVRRVRRAGRSPTDRTLAVAAGGTFFVWLVHTSVDWLHNIPGVTGVAICAAGVLVGPWTRRRSRPGRRRKARIAALVSAGAGVALAAFMLIPAILADRYETRARATIASDPAAAVRAADDALRYNDESLPTYYAKAAAFARLGSYEGALGTLQEAVRREPSYFLTWSLLGDLAARRGELDLATRYYGQAARLNPRDAGLKQLARDPALPDP